MNRIFFIIVLCGRCVIAYYVVSNIPRTRVISSTTGIHGVTVVHHVSYTSTDGVTVVHHVTYASTDGVTVVHHVTYASTVTWKQCLVGNNQEKLKRNRSSTFISKESLWKFCCVS